MSRIAGKVWGQTELVHANGVLEFHRIEYKAKGTCSKHKHKYKFNAFYVESGELEIIIYKNDYDLVDTTVLKAGDMTIAKPGEYHSFKANAKTICYEFYWVELNHDDIERESVGGI